MASSPSVRTATRFRLKPWRDAWKGRCRDGPPRPRAKSDRGDCREPRAPIRVRADEAPHQDASRGETPMPTIKSDDGCPIHVEVEGRSDTPVLILSNSLGTNLHMWDEQAKPLTEHFRLVRYDRRGHGQ